MIASPILFVISNFFYFSFFSFDFISFTILVLLVPTVFVVGSSSGSSSFFIF
jgi:hypothetical protein